MVLLRVIKYLVGCVVRVCNELSQNMSSLNKMFKYHLLEPKEIHGQTAYNFKLILGGYSLDRNHVAVLQNYTLEQNSAEPWIFPTKRNPGQRRVESITNKVSS